MNKHFSFPETGLFPRLITDYLSGDPKLKKLYANFPDAAGYYESMQARKDFPAERRTLIQSAFRKQNASIKLSALQIKNINSLTESDTFTVTTGHQLCLFTGPLYFIYKILSTVHCCRELEKAYPSANFVPVFWMASEDHDVDEIRSFRVMGQNISWNTDQKGAVGRFNTKGLDEVFEQLSVLLTGSPGKDTLLDLFKESYLNHADLASATRYLVNKLFGELGVLVIDGDDRDLKGSFSGILERELMEQRSEKAVQDASEMLKQMGYGAQVNPRSINLFYLHSGGRDRLEGNSRDGFSVVNTNIQFSSDKIRDELREHPERFSPNVVIRPLYQEFLLPNIGYAGGAGEISYWLQLKEVFGIYRVPFPILQVRNSVLLADAGAIKKMTNLGLEVKDLFRPVDEIIRAFTLSHTEGEIDFSEEQQQISEAFDRLMLKAAQVDPTLRASSEGEKQKALKGIENLTQKVFRARKQKFDVQINQITKAKEKLFPGNALQERVENICLFVEFEGNLHFDRILDSFSGLHPGLMVLQKDLN